MSDIKKYPPALNASHHIAENYKHGDFIEDELIIELLEIDLSIDTSKTPDEIRKDLKRSQLYQMSAQEMLKATLLRDHNFLLIRDVKRKGWNIVLPSDQTKIAMQTLENDLRRSTRKAASRLVHVDREQLSVEQLRENSEAVAKVAQLKKVQNQSLGFSFDKKAIGEN